jgi:malonyl CoA-acyl carrier protein transacylase
VIRRRVDLRSTENSRKSFTGTPRERFEAKEADVHSMLLFSGFGTFNGTLLRPLREFHDRPTHRPLLNAAVEAVQQALDHAGPEVTREHLPRGVPLREWLAGAAPSSPKDLEHSVVEGLLTHIYQLCLLQPDPLAARPDPADGGPVVSLGHSLGMASAIVAGLRIDNHRDFVRQAYDSILFVTLGLLRCHQVAGTGRADAAAVRRYAELSGTRERPTPMATVTNVDLGDLRAAVTAFNDDTAPGLGPVEVGLVNSPRALVLTGGPAPLLEFWSRHRELLQADGAGWSFVRTTAPFHSTVLEPALDLLTADRRQLDRAQPGSELTLPVWSMDGTRNLQQSADLYDDCMEQVFCRPVDWSAAVRAAVVSSDPQLVLDYGPGVAVRLFTRDSLKELGHPLRFSPVTARG